jgi:autotransporter-associated beta strand protein
MTANTFAGGTEARGGYLNANVTGSLSAGPVLADDGQLNYNANAAAAQPVQVQNNGQANLGVLPSSVDRFNLQDLGAVSGNHDELEALTVGTTLNLSPGAMIAHEVFDTGATGNPAGLGAVGTPSYVFGVAASMELGPGVVFAFGSNSGSPWRGFGGDRGDRVIGSANDDPTVHLVIMGNAEIDSLHNTLVINHAIGGSGSFVKRGGGVVAINNLTNPYAGTIAVQSGALLINGHMNSVTQTTVQSGGTLGGTGQLAGNVTVADGGHLSPGHMRPDDLIGNFNIAGDVTMSPGSYLDVQVNGDGVSDSLSIGGALTLDGILNVTGLEDFLPGNNYTLFNVFGPITNNGLELGFAPDGFTFSLVIQQPSGGDPGSVILATTVPEPGVISLLSISAMVGLRRRRSSRR